MKVIKLITWWCEKCGLPASIEFPPAVPTLGDLTCPRDYCRQPISAGALDRLLKELTV